MNEVEREEKKKKEKTETNITEANKKKTRLQIKFCLTIRCWLLKMIPNFLFINKPTI